MKYSVRASSFGSFFDCSERWAEIHLLGNYLPSTAPAAIGSAVHASTAEFDQHRVDHDPLPIEDAAEVAVDYITNPQDEINWGGMNKDKAIDIAVATHTRYCRDVAPSAEFIKVEATLEPLEIEVNDEVTLELTGTLDRIRKLTVSSQDFYGVSDVKTGARAMSMNSGRHKAQVGIYSLLAEHTFSLPMDLDETIIKLQTSQNYDAGIEEVAGSRLALLGDENRIGMLDVMGRLLKQGLFYGNPQSWLCSEKYCPKYHNCHFR